MLLKHLCTTYSIKQSKHITLANDRKKKLFYIEVPIADTILSHLEIDDRFAYCVHTSNVEEVTKLHSVPKESKYNFCNSNVNSNEQLGCYRYNLTATNDFCFDNNFIFAGNRQSL